MKAETKQRIKKYRQDLPHMREKVFAAFLMLLVATCVAATATYAWVTLSSSPEVSGMVTSMAANGNLEIALSKEDGSQPDEFDIDESVTTKGSDVTVSNLQWGNLVNLSDASYGIDDIRLRPARLNTASLLNNPLWGAVYSADGRIETLNYNYTYTVFDGNEFLASDKYGVRAISSYILKTTDATAQERSEKINAVANAQTKVAEKYEEVISSFSIMSNMINAYVGDQVSEYLGSSSQTDLGQYIADMIKLYEKLLTAMDYQKDAYVALANLQIYLFAKANSIDYVEISWRDIEASCNKFDAANAANKNETISITGLAQFVRDYNTLAKDLTYLKQYDEDYKLTKTPYYWGTGDHCVPGYYINNMINRLIQYNDMYLYIDDVKVTFAQIKSYATQLLGNSEREVFIEYGIIKRFEQSCIPSSNRMNGRASVNIKYSVILNVKGSASTTATGASYFEGDLGAAQDSGLDLSDAVAEDTYGLVVDLWVRTNAEETCLTLEPATANDENGNIVSYDGLNRVWGATGEANLTHNSTTQGGGSCYVFYADSPEDHARSLSLLDAMKVAFVGEDGQLMATATMDTENYYAANGRVTVPLVIDTLSGVTYTYELEDDTGAAAADVGENASGSTEGTDKKKTATVTGLAILKADQPIRVTAIIYLDGDLLENEDVLAENNIQGSLNIQFGSSQNLTTIGDSDLLMAEREVTATLDDGKTEVEIDLDTASSVDDKTVTVKVAVEGTQPTNMTACFLRAINNTQGTREEEMTFTKQDDGTWTVSHVFEFPGTYYLRYIRLDGVEYALEQPLKVTVKSDGYTVKTVDWSVVDATVRTSDSSYPITVSAQFVADDPQKLPKTVEARLVRADGNTANITMSRNSEGKYSGTTTITTSGVWTLQYLLLDGKYFDLGDRTRTVDLALGLYVKVEHIYGQLTEDFKSEENKTYDKELAVTVYDNVGNKLEGLENLTLYYSYGSSATNTRNAKLTYNESDGKYYGTLALDAPGRYNFLSVQMGNSYLTRCTESPTYILTSPDPVIYDKENSGCTLNDENGIQFAPLSTDAKINNICIENAGAATVQVVVYNETYGGYKTVEAYSLDAGKLYITLPTYQLPTGEKDSEGKDILGAATQEGTWHVVAMYLTDCTGEDEAFHEEANPLIWVAEDEYGNAYLSTLESTDCERKDFSKLTTTVSSQVKVTMDAGTTALGDASTPFGTVHYADKTKLSVEIKDGNGRTIPKDKITSVTLHLTYSENKDAAKYGYAVNIGGLTYDIALTYDEEEASYRIATDGAPRWVYVGEYKVTSLEVALSGGKTSTLTPGTDGVPEMYTVTSAAPTADSIMVTNNTGEEDTVTQSTTVFGADANGNNVTGTFLQAHDLGGTNVSLQLKDTEGEKLTGVTLGDVSVKLELTYTGGSEKYGGYTFTSSAYQNLSIDMEHQQGTSNYNAGSSVLLAGTYTGEVVLTMSGKTKTLPLAKEIEVYSKRPDVTMALADGTPTTVTATDGGILYENTFTANNRIVNSGHSAVLFASSERFTTENNKGEYKYNEWFQSKTAYDTTYSNTFADYTMPSVVFTLTGGGDTCKNFSLAIPGNDGRVATFTTGSGASTVVIGSVKEGTTTKQGIFDNQYVDFTYTTETPAVIGTQSISAITAVVGSDTYELTLASELSIVQNNSAVPSLTFIVGDERFTTPATEISEDGRSFSVTLPSLMTISGTESAISEKTIYEYRTTTSGDDPDAKAAETAFAEDWNWVTTNYGSTTNVYTVNSSVISGTHSHLWTNGTYYYKQYTSSLYSKQELIRTGMLTITISGQTVDVTTEKLYSVKTSLKSWIVDGKEYKPEDEIIVSGNSVAIAVFGDDEELQKTTVITRTTDGDTDYVYKATCSAVYTTYVGEGTTTEGTIYCSHRTCDYKYESDAQSAAQNDTTLKKPTNTGYSEVSSVVEGIAEYDFADSKWERSGEPVVKNGTTTTVTCVYDANGNLISTTTN